MVLDAVAREYHAEAWAKKFQAQITEAAIGRQKVLLLKPQTFMNLSGNAVSDAMRFYKIPPESICVIHDELDLLPGKLRVKTGGGNGGHNGLRNIDVHIGPDYKRVRIGIGHPGDRDRVSDYVLADFTKTEWKLFEVMVAEIARHIALLLQGDDAGFMNKIALAIKE
jgi:PTH1 family peptidyl-tRNA hydrolase